MKNEKSIINDIILGLIVGLVVTPFVTILLITTESYTKINNVDPVTVGLVVIPCFIIFFILFFRKKNKNNNKS